MSMTELPSGVFYVGIPSMPAGMTVDEYRRNRAPRRSWRRRSAKGCDRRETMGAAGPLGAAGRARLAEVRAT
jgi:hypothetical protein